MTPPRILPVGDRALLVEMAVLDEVLTLFRRAAASRPAGVIDLVPAACTLLVQFDPAVLPVRRVAAWLRGLAPQASEQPEELRGRAAGAPHVVIPVHYQGEDLEEVAQMLRLGCSELVERHTGAEYLAAFAGFAPGFVYLSGGDPRLHGVARRATPRTRVPAGSVAVAGDFSAVYPSESPGGWRLLGVTPLKMWDLQRASPAWVQPGFKVRFRDLSVPPVHYSLPPAPKDTDVQVRGEKAGEAPRDSGVSELDAGTASASWVEVLSPGLQTLVQDRGRPGLAALGVSASGALDRSALARANGLVGNPSDRAGLENAWGGLALMCHGKVVMAVTGAPVNVSITTPSGMRLPAAAGHRLELSDGQVVRLGRPRVGMRCYVAVQGGWGMPAVLGSRSTDVLAGIGPAVLRRGDRLPVQPVRLPLLPGCDEEPLACPESGEAVMLRIVLGPRDDWFDKSSLRLLQDQAWEVTAQSNRVGLRLAGGKPLQRRDRSELLSEGMVAGALQVPPDGQPVLFLADHPLTGGYPVVAVVVDRDLDRLAQVAPGMHLKFVLAGSGEKGLAG